MGDPILPIRTDRTRLRLMTLDDAPVVTAYRNDPEVARYQDWDLPVPVERVVAGIERLRPGADLAPGVRTNLAIEVDGVLVGDVYVGIEAEGGVAEIGFTLIAEHQGRGYASEAAAAVVAVLFERLGVHRVMGQLDPVNVASQRTLERLGLVFESFSPGSYHCRGEWTDNMVYAASREQYEAWRDRPRDEPDEVRLVELDHTNARDYRRLETHYSQQRFVTLVVASFADALVPDVHNGAPVVPWLRGIEADGEAVGFMMTAEATDHHPEPYLWRLVIDRRHQGRGIGRRAVDALVDRLRHQGHLTLLVHWREGAGGPRPFYEGLGFVATGRAVDDDIEARLEL